MKNNLFRILLSIFLVTFISCSINRKDMSENNKFELSLLDKLAEKRIFYRDSLQNYIDSIMLQLHRSMSYTDKERYDINKEMLLKTQMFSYDYAHQCSQKLQMLSQRIGDANIIAESKILSSFYLAQSCMFTEALNMLNQVDLNEDISKETKSLYYFYKGIAYQRMAIYVKDTLYSRQYEKKGIDIFEKCLEYSDDSAIKNFVKGRINERKGNMRNAQLFFQKALDNINDNDMLLTLTLSSLAKAFKHQNKADSATYYYIKASQLNIREAMNSSIAVVDLADYLFRYYGNSSEAKKYLEISIDNGEYFGMRSQITRIDSMFPILSEMKKKHDKQIIILISVVIGVLLLSLYYLLKKNKAKKKNIETLKDENSQLKELLKDYESLKSKASRISNNNQIKELYIGELLQSNSIMISKGSDFITNASLLINNKKYETLLKALKEFEKSINKKNQIEKFDEMFLSVFPSFVEDFNSLLTHNDIKTEASLKDMLTPSMRIFALVRLGIKDNQQIAQILDYSYNTIINYRTRVKNLAKDPDTFEDKIMEIGE